MRVVSSQVRIFQVEGVDFVAYVELLGVAPVFLDADALNIDVGRFLPEAIIKLNELGNGNSIQADAEVVVVKNFPFAGADGVDISLCREATLADQVIDAAGELIGRVGFRGVDTFECVIKGFRVKIGAFEPLFLGVEFDGGELTSGIPLGQAPHPMVHPEEKNDDNEKQGEQLLPQAHALVKSAQFIEVGAHGVASACWVGSGDVSGGASGASSGSSSSVTVC